MNLSIREFKSLNNNFYSWELYWICSWETMYYRISFMKFIGFLSTYQTVPKSNHSEKELLITAKKKSGGSCKANFIDLVLRIKSEWLHTEF